MQYARRLVWLAAVLLSVSCTETAGAKNTVSERGEALKSPLSKKVVTFHSGELTLHGVVYTPSGPGPFPALLWNHGSWGDPMEAFDHLAPTFTDAGWVFFGPFRRGQGLSRAAGPYIMDEIERAAGSDAKAAKMVSLLTHEHLDDQLAAYAWLKEQRYVLAERIAVAGNSFGGVEVVLGAGRVRYCAAINGAGAASSWARAPELREVMTRAARASQAPMFLFQAANDFDLSPSRTLAEAMGAAGKTVKLKVYPDYGSNRSEGHNFAWRGGAVWGNDVLAFLREHCPS
jgi:carboxymethylenebutenolidase